MADAKVEVHGAAELGRGTRKLADKIEEAAPAAFRTVADRTAAAVRGRVPKQSGRLAGSVAVLEREGGAEIGYGPGVPYAGWVEFGGSRGRPYVPEGRYLYPTALDAEPQLVAAGENAAEDEIARFRWESPSV